MDYRVNELATLSGVSPRTLRYYDGIGLLKPARVDPNGYRIYGEREVDLLQQILFYRELGMELEAIRTVLAAPDFDRARALREHLDALQKKREQLGLLIKNVQKTLRSVKGEYPMANKEKFEGFKKELIDKNDAAYGREVTAKYGKEALEASNAKLAGMTPEQWEGQETLTREMFALLREGMAQHDPAGAAAQKAAALHRQWLCAFWKNGAYSKEVHRVLAESYVADERFKAYYDKELGAGGAEFLRDAIAEYTK